MEMFLAGISLVGLFLLFLAWRGMLKDMSDLREKVDGFFDRHSEARSDWLDQECEFKKQLEEARGESEEFSKALYKAEENMKFLEVRLRETVDHAESLAEAVYCKDEYIEKLKKERMELDCQAQKLSDALTKSQTRVNDLARQSSALQERNEVLERKVKTLDDLNRDLDQKFNNREGTLGHLSRKVDEQLTTIRELGSSLRIHQEAKERFAEKLKKAGEMSPSRKMKKENSDLRAVNKVYDKEIDRQEKIIAAREKEIEQLKQQLAKLGGKVDERGDSGRSPGEGEVREGAELGKKEGGKAEGGGAG